jgi:hypothetical protein
VLLVVPLASALTNALISSWSELTTWLVMTSCAIIQDTGQKPKAAVLARFKGNNTRRPLFFSACVGMVLAQAVSSKQHSRFPLEKNRAAKLVVLLSDFKRQSSNSQLTGEHPTPTLDFFRAISAGECLVVSTVALYVAPSPTQNSLTPLGSVVLPLLKITM